MAHNPYRQISIFRQVGHPPNRRMAGMWGTAFDVGNAPSAYPIIEYTSDGGVPRFRVWESGTGVWVDLGLSPGFLYDNWVTFRTQLLPSGEFLLTVITDQGNLEYTTTTSAPDASVDILNVILQGHNTTAGVTYDIYWDNFKSSTTVSPVITAPAVVFENTTGYAASVPDAGMGATYVWTLSDGTVTSGGGTNSIIFTSGDSPSMTVSVIVTPADGCAASAAVTLTVLDECQMIDFSAPLTLSNTQASGVWYTDRYNPNGFVGQATAPDATPNTLHVSINAADGQVTGFYNTQGRKYDLIDGTQSIQADLYIPAGWASTSRRMAGMWGTAFDGSNAVSGFPIIEYTSEGGVPRFRVWESGTGVWVDLGLPAGFLYDNWVTFRTQLLPSGEFLLTVITDQGNLEYTTTTSAPDASVDILNVILQGHNTTAGVTYDIYWDNFKSSTTVSPVITAPAIVFENTAGYAASVPDAGMGATYVWTLSDGTVTSGGGTNSIIFTSGDSPSMTVSVIVTPADGCAASAAVTLTVLDECQMIDFSAPLILSNTQAAGVWYTDRYNPNGFVGQATAPDATPNTLHVTIDATDAQGVGFYNTQGRKYDLIDGTQSIQMDLFVATGWAAAHRRMAGMWGTAFDAGNAVSAYPIIEFTSDTLGAGGPFVPRFRVWESGTGTWRNLGLPSGFVYNQWVTLRTQLLSSGEFLYTVLTAQGDLQYTTTTSAPDASVDILNVILQGHNTTAGVTYDIYWDNFKSTTTLTPVITAANSVCRSSTGNLASVSGSGPYLWTVDGGTLTGGQGTANITYTAGTGSQLTLNCTIGTGACAFTTSRTVVLNPLPIATITTPLIVASGAANLPATIPDAGGGATYMWTIVNGSSINNMITGGQGTSSMSYTAGTPGTMTINVTVTNSFGCTSMGSQIVTVIPVGPSSLQWVLDTGDNDGGCPDATNCCQDIICYDLVYTPAVSGRLTTYTTGFLSNCLGPVYPPPIALDMSMIPTPLNNSCVMTDNSFESDDCTNNMYLFNSSGQNGSVMVVGGVTPVPITIHKVCFQISAGETINLTEDVPTDLTASIDLLDMGGMVIGQYTDFPTFAPTMITKPLPVIPADGTLSVSCVDLAVPPVPPTVNDYCGTLIVPTGPVILDTPDPLTCVGTRKYTYTYTDCAGYAQTWSYTYTVNDNIAPVLAAAPADVAVECIGEVPVMTNLTWTDNCDAGGSVAGVDGPLVGGACEEQSQEHGMSWMHVEILRLQERRLSQLMTIQHQCLLLHQPMLR
ncbi:MAG: hypothetical protein IPN60_15755 [Saprospiraceae bacterium]|nr:hypothetical protein [Candidatus Opimibacter skivensis]